MLTRKVHGDQRCPTRLATLDREVQNLEEVDGVDVQEDWTVGR
jgi:hypothetical protein